MKTNTILKKTIGLSFGATLLLLNMSTALAQAEPCNAILGITDGVPSPAREGRAPNIEDSGKLNFNLFGASTLTENKANAGCVEEKSKIKTPSSEITSYPINGWAWNDNLGFVSFSCKKTTSTNPPLTRWKNNRALCAPDNHPNATEYGTYIVNNGGQNESAPLIGFAWGDNIGWISMSCKNGTNMGIDCGNTDYGVRAVLADMPENITNINGCSGSGRGGTFKRGDLYGYAWTDTVGWMNMCGAKTTFGGFKIKIDDDISCKVCNYSDPVGSRLVDAAICPPEQTVEPTECPRDDGGDGDGGDGGGGGGGVCSNIVKFNRTGEPVYADGEDAYTIGVNLTRNGQAVTAPNYNVTITPTFTNLVRADQTVPCSGDSCSNGAIPPAALQANGNSYSAQVTSFAPTDGITDSLKLDRVSVNVNAPNGTPLLTNQSCSTGNNLAANFKFEKPIDVTNISTENVPNQLFAITNAPQPIDIEVTNYRPNAGANSSVRRANLNNVKIEAQLYDCTDKHDINFIPPGTSPAGLFPTTNYCPPNNQPNNVVDTFIDLASRTANQIANGIQTYLYQPSILATKTTDQSPQVVNQNALALRTAIKIDGANGRPTVHYLTSASGNVNNSTVVTQGAAIKGDVRVDTLNKNASAAGVNFKISESLGEKSKSRRELFTRTVEEVLGRPQVSPANSVNADRNINSDYLTQKSISGILYRVRSAGLPTPCKIIINQDINIASQRTLVTKGCDIYIDNNVLQDRTNLTGELGIIALQDFSLSGTRKGGNIYICSTVTDIRANIVADGSIFSYGSLDADACANKNALINRITGRPEFTAPNDARTVLKNQLTIKGALVSQNTFGGSVQTQPILGDGTIAERNNVGIARQYDLNFLRYIHAAIPRTITFDSLGTTTTKNVTCWAEDVKLSQLLEVSGGPSFAPDNTTSPYYSNDPTLPNPATAVQFIRHLENNHYLKICGATPATIDPTPRQNNPELKGVVNILFNAPSKDLPIFNRIK